ncbi:MAG: CapA family protein [Candidatus Taylorbacteria bacterium]|nr:CapA family protein [Candidatus Taylorbacteria bacterium]
MTKPTLFIVLVACLGIALYFGFSAVNTKVNSRIEANSEHLLGQRPFLADKQGDELELLFWGDAMFGRNVAKNMAKGMDPFEGIATSTAFLDADAIILNLEGPITASTTKCQNKAYSFRFEPEIASELEKQGIFAVNLANNHTFDCLEKGRADTRGYLEQAGVNFFGGGTMAESYVELDISERKVAFIGLDLTFDYKLDASYLKLIELLNITNDVIIVSIHWGEEYREQPTQSQRLVGIKLIDAGADAVIGHHPHVIEPLEIYKNSPIFYSLGNFIFDQIGEAQNTGLGVGITLRDNASTTIRLHPVKIDKQRPKLIEGKDKQTICKKIRKVDDVSDEYCQFEI